MARLRLATVADGLIPTWRSMPPTKLCFWTSNRLPRCELLHKIAALGLTGITPVLDNARDQRNAVVMACTEQRGITLLFLPSYSPNRHLIERLWKFLKRLSLDGRDHPAFANFREALEETLTQLATTLNFQRLENVSRMPASGIATCPQNRENSNALRCTHAKHGQVQYALALQSWTSTSVLERSRNSR